MSEHDSLFLKWSKHDMIPSRQVMFKMIFFSIHEQFNENFPISFSTYKQNWMQLIEKKSWGSPMTNEKQTILVGILFTKYSEN
jgi:hypothetical protein